MLHHNEHIGIMAPSSFVEKDDIEVSKSYIEERGFTVTVHPQTYARLNQSAGTAQEKAEALHTLYEDKDINAIWAAGGGNRALDLLNHIDFDLIQANPKPLIGFSDITVLLNAIFAKTQQHGIHACNFKDLKAHGLENIASMHLKESVAITSGKTSGTAIGGCLSLFHLLVGTDKCPSLEGSILFLEDSADHISRFDRMLLDLKHKDVFKKISGLVLGEFHDLQDGTRPFGFSLQDCVENAIDGQDIPVILNAPFGHGTKNHPFPIGKTAHLDTNKTSIEFDI